MAEVVPFSPRQSFGKKSVGKSGPCRVTVQGKAFDLVQFYADFPDRWMEFLRAHFPSPIAVAFHFGVSERAAEKWWHGIGGPRGDKVLVALRTVPGAEEDLLRAA